MTAIPQVFSGLTNGRSGRAIIGIKTASPALETRVVRVSDSADVIYIFKEAVHAAYRKWDYSAFVGSVQKGERSRDIGKG